MTDDVSRRGALALMLATALNPPGAYAALASQPVAIRTADGRRSSVTRWVPRRRVGTILFSHGALSAPWKYEALIAPLVAAGWEVWAPLHVDSTDHPDAKRFPGLASWPARIEDMRALANHVGVASYVAAGHSYGALGALTLGGALPTRPPGIVGPLADRRVSCVLALSPPGAGMGLIDAAGFAGLARPALIQTGTRDIPPGATDADAWRSHLAAFEAAAPGGDRYGLVLDGADHYFGGLICRPEVPGPPQREQLDRAVAVSRLFLDSCARRDRTARAALMRWVSGGALRRR